MTTHTCIKPECSNSYQDEEPDAYYCPSCAEANKSIAKQVDAKVASRPKRQSANTPDPYHGQKTVVVKGMKFLHVKL